MLSIFKKTIPTPPDLSGLVTDMHSHLVPGIDDGSPDVETSIELIRGLTALGYKKFIATPHILWDIYKNDKDTITAAFQELQLALKANNMNVPMQFAAEYFLDDHVSDLIEEEIPLLTIKKNWVLTEFSFVSPPLDLKEKLFAMQMAGYHPVLAHPERYGYFSRDKNMYDTLRSAGYYFQVNLLSLAGYYGRGPQELGEYLIKKKYVDLLGSDLHHIRHLQTLQAYPQLTDIIKEVQDSGKLLNASL
jgi:protein-tyrosine phosphatase